MQSCQNPASQPKHTEPPCTLYGRKKSRIKAGGRKRPPANHFAQQCWAFFALPHEVVGLRLCHSQGGRNLRKRKETKEFARSPHRWTPKKGRIERLDGWLPKDNCKSRSEFIEKALSFYMGYLGTEDISSYLSKALLASIQGTLQKTENRVANNLFRLSVEISMMMHLLATTLDITDEELHRLRGRCVAEVKRTRGKIRLDDAVDFQSSPEAEE